MTYVLYLVGWNVVIAAAMAVAVWLLCRTNLLRRRPAMCHGLWLLVLLKLVTPPVLPVPLLPAIATSAPSRPAVGPTMSAAMPIKADDSGAITDHDATLENRVIELRPEAKIARALAAPPARTSFLPPGFRSGWREFCLALLAVSFSVSLAVWLAAMRQFYRMRRLVRLNSAKCDRAVGMLRDVSRLLTTRSAPNLWIVDASVTPMLWAEPGKSAVILPRQLADSLDDDQLRAVLAHELAHFARRDHWANMFAFVVTTLFWWNPVAWLARREMAAAAEACCDALALARLAGSRKCYAETLLTVVDFVTSSKPLRPMLGVTFGASHSLRQRFELVANSQVKSGISHAGRVLLVLLAASLLLLPARAQETNSLAGPVSGAKSTGGDEESTNGLTVNTDETPAGPKHFLTGIVSDKESHQPIADAQVNILVDEKEGARAMLGATTDADGRYRIEVPLGSFRIWFPRLKPGYWLDPDESIAALTTSPDKPIATRDFAARRGNAWPVQVTTEGGQKGAAEVMASVVEVEDDSQRKAWLNKAEVSFQKSPNQTISALDANGRGGFTQCGQSGKLIVIFSGGPIKAFMTEFIVDPGFEISKIKSVAPVAGTDKVTMTDVGGLKATIGGAKVTLKDGQPLLTFRLDGKSPLQVQSFTGRALDDDGKPVEGVRIGSAVGTANGSGVTEYVASTDKDGRFTLNIPIDETASDPKQKRHLTLVITKDGYASFDSPRTNFPSKPGPAIDVGQVVMNAGHSLAIRVVDENKTPLPGAVVEPQSEYSLRRQVIRTDAQGRGVLRNLPAGVVGVYATYGTLMHQSKIVVDDKPVDGEVTTLILRPFNAPASQAKPFPEPPPVGAVAPEWSVVGWTDGQTRKLSNYRGKVVVLDFWGIWCSACLNGLPGRKEVEAKYAGRSDIVFLGIHSAGAEISQVQKLQRVKDWKLITGLDEGNDVVEGATARAYGAKGWPTTVIIDREGKVAYNSNLEKWTALTSFKEQLRLAKAFDLPALKPDASFEEQVVRSNIMNVLQLSELIDRAVESK